MALLVSGLVFVASAAVSDLVMNKRLSAGDSKNVKMTQMDGGTLTIHCRSYICFLRFHAAADKCLELM